MRPTQEVVNEFVKLAGRPFLERPDYFFECNICNSILEDPVCCEGGLHTFCRTCLTAYMASNTRPRCPRGECKLPQHAADLRPAPIALHMCIRNLQIKCTLKCPWIGKASDWGAHLQNDCPNSVGCESVASLQSAARMRRTHQMFMALEEWLSQGVRSNPIVSSSSSSSQAHPESDIPGTTAAQGTVAVRGSNANPVDYEALRQSISAEVQQAIDRQFLLYSCGNPQREEHSQATRQDAEAPRNEEDIPPLRTLPSPVPSLLDGLPPPAYRSRLGSVVSIDTILREAPPSYRPRSRQARVTLELPHFPDLSPLPFTFTRRR